jgi:PilZ domain
MRWPFPILEPFPKPNCPAAPGVNRYFGDAAGGALLSIIAISRRGCGTGMGWNYGTNEPEWDLGGADYLRRLKADQDRPRPTAEDQASLKEDQSACAIAQDPLLVPAQGCALDRKPASATSESNPSERRRTPRFKCEGSAEFRVGGTDVRTWGTFTDLSVHGCYIELTATFPVGTMVDLVLGLNGFRVNVKGEVRVSYPLSRYRGGLPRNLTRGRR